MFIPTSTSHQRFDFRHTNFTFACVNVKFIEPPDIIYFLRVISLKILMVKIQIGQSCLRTFWNPATQSPLWKFRWIGDFTLQKTTLWNVIGITSKYHAYREACIGISYTASLMVWQVPILGEVYKRIIGWNGMKIAIVGSRCDVCVRYHIH